MSYVHRITGDGESDDGVGVFGMELSMMDGDVCSAVGEYLERPQADVDPDTLPTYRSDTVQLNVVNTPYPTATAVVGTVVTFSANVLPFRAAGTALVDADGVVFYVLSYSGYDVTVDREGFALGAITDFFLLTPRVITYAAHAEGLPQVEKFYEQAWVAFQLLRGGREYQLSTRAYGESMATLTIQTVTYDSDLSTYLYADREFLDRRYVPTDQTRAVGLQVTITVGEPISYFQLGAMAFTLKAESNRTGNRRG